MSVIMLLAAISLAADPEIREERFDLTNDGDVLRSPTGSAGALGIADARFQVRLPEPTPGYRLEIRDRKELLFVADLPANTPRRVKYKYAVPEEPLLVAVFLRDVRGVVRCVRYTILDRYSAAMYRDVPWNAWERSLLKRLEENRTALTRKLWSEARVDLIVDDNTRQRGLLHLPSPEAMRYWDIYLRAANEILPQEEVIERVRKRRGEASEPGQAAVARLIEAAGE